jgi:hypothetical protein
MVRRLWRTKICGGLDRPGALTYDPPNTGLILRTHPSMPKNKFSAMPRMIVLYANEMTACISAARRISDAHTAAQKKHW